MKELTKNQLEDDLNMNKLNYKLLQLKLIAGQSHYSFQISFDVSSF